MNEQSAGISAKIWNFCNTLRAESEKTIADPACGTGGFFLAAYDYLSNPAHYKPSWQKSGLSTVRWRTVVETEVSTLESNVTLPSRLRRCRSRPSREMLPAVATIA
jgi:hypothetical protein